MLEIHGEITHKVTLGDGDIGYRLGWNSGNKVFYMRQLSEVHEPRTSISDNLEKATPFLVMEFKGDADIDFLIKELELLKSL